MRNLSVAFREYTNMQERNKWSYVLRLGLYILAIGLPFFFFFHLRVADLSSSFLLFFSFNEEVAGSGTSSL